MKYFILLLFTLVSFGEVKIIENKYSNLQKVLIKHWAHKMQNDIKITTEGVYLTIEEKGKDISITPISFKSSGKNEITAIFWIDKSKLKNVKISVTGFGANQLLDFPYLAIFRYNSTIKKFEKTKK